MDRETYNKEVDRIAEEIRQLSLERHRLYEREKHLIRRLVEVRRLRESVAGQEEQAAQEEENQGGRGEEGISPSECRRRKIDRFGKKLKVGDTVELLTSGRCIRKLWTIYGLTDKRVLCERSKGVFKMHREYWNVKKR